MNKKYSMHMVINRFIPLFAFVILGVVAYIISIYADDKKFNMVAIIFLGILAIIAIVMHIFVIRVLDYLMFNEDKIYLCSKFRKNQSLNYDEYVWTIGTYKTLFIRRRILIFTPKEIMQLYTVIDTSNKGNCIFANKNMILYCFYDNELLNYLKTKTNLTYIENK